MSPDAAARRAYALAPGLRLAISGDPVALAHFDAEYGRTATRGDDANVVVRFGDLPRTRSAATDGPPDASDPLGELLESRADAHRWLSWRVALSAGSTTGATAAVRVGGRPRSVVLSLVQGYVVEPLVSLVAPSVGQVLVPGAAIASDSGDVLVLGSSGAGKSSVSARALARGLEVVGDDQVFVDAEGMCRPFPRRVRVYPDLELTAREAWHRLSAASRQRLAFHRALGRWTRGRLRPSLPVDRTELGASVDAAPGGVGRVVLVETGVPAVALGLERASVGDVLVAMAHLARAQRARFCRVAAAEWHLVAESVARRELDIVAAGVARAEIVRLRIPRGWPAVEAVDGLARVVGVEGATEGQGALGEPGLTAGVVS
jgi:hypothetical protein